MGGGDRTLFPAQEILEGRREGRPVELFDFCWTVQHHCDN